MYFVFFFFIYVNFLLLFVQTCFVHMGSAAAIAYRCICVVFLLLVHHHLKFNWMASCSRLADVSDWLDKEKEQNYRNYYYFFFSLNSIQMIRFNYFPLKSERLIFNWKLGPSLLFFSSFLIGQTTLFYSLFVFLFICQH